MFEQPLIDRAELLNAKITIIDVPAAGFRALKRKRIDRVGHDRIGEANSREKRRPVTIEKAAVIGWQADRGIALVDRPAQIIDDRPIAGGCVGKYVVLGFALADAAAHFVAQAIVVIAAVAHRQQVAVFGIEDEQEPIKKDQRGVANVRQRKRSALPWRSL